MPRKTYIVGVIDRAITYYAVEAEDARTAAENWQDGQVWDRDDAALECEGPCSVREQQPDGTLRTVPPAEWADEGADLEGPHQRRLTEGGEQVRGRGR